MSNFYDKAKEYIDEDDYPSFDVFVRKVDIKVEPGFINKHGNTLLMYSINKYYKYSLDLIELFGITNNLMVVNNYGESIIYKAIENNSPESYEVYQKILNLFIEENLIDNLKRLLVLEVNPLTECINKERYMVLHELLPYLDNYNILTVNGETLGTYFLKAILSYVNKKNPILSSPYLKECFEMVMSNIDRDIKNKYNESVNSILETLSIDKKEELYSFDIEDVDDIYDDNNNSLLTLYKPNEFKIVPDLNEMSGSYGSVNIVKDSYGFQKVVKTVKKPFSKIYNVKGSQTFDLPIYDSDIFIEVEALKLLKTHDKRDYANEIFGMILRDKNVSLVLRYDGVTIAKYFQSYNIGQYPFDIYRDSFVKNSQEVLRTLLISVREIHKTGIIQCDISHNNVLINEVDGRISAKVIDFGMSLFQMYGQADPGQYICTVTTKPHMSHSMCKLIDNNDNTVAIFKPKMSFIPGQNYYNANIYSAGCTFINTYLKKTVNNFISYKGKFYTVYYKDRFEDNETTEKPVILYKEIQAYEQNMINLLGDTYKNALLYILDIDVTPYFKAFLDDDDNISEVNRSYGEGIIYPHPTIYYNNAYEYDDIALEDPLLHNYVMTILENEYSYSGKEMKTSKYNLTYKNDIYKTYSIDMSIFNISNKDKYETLLNMLNIVYIQNKFNLDIFVNIVLFYLNQLQEVDINYTQIFTILNYFNSLFTTTKTDIVTQLKSVKEELNSQVKIDYEDTVQKLLLKNKYIPINVHIQYIIIGLQQKGIAEDILHKLEYGIYSSLIMFFFKEFPSEPLTINWQSYIRNTIFPEVLKKYNLQIDIRDI